MPEQLQLLHMKEERKKVLLDLAKSLDLSIKDLNLLNTAFVHGSYIKENTSKNISDNERFEFFGDAVLKLYISEYLMDEYKDYLEGQLSKLRAFVVSEKVLGKIALKLKLGDYLLLGKNEKKSLPVSILADSLEALIAVIYYECGPKKAREFILNHWIEHIESADKNQDKDNFKAVLQEYTQGDKLGLPVYKTLIEAGPDHNKEFEVAVYLKENELARGTGKTKKEASQEAAKNALKCFELRKKKELVK